MLKFFGGLPRWLTVILALGAAAGLWVIPYLNSSLHGRKLVFSIAFGAVFTMLAVGLPQIQQWQSRQEALLQVKLMTEPSELTIPSYADADGVIAARLSVEEAECLSSLQSRRSVRHSRRFDAGVVDLESLEGGSNTESSAKDISFRDLMRIEEKGKSGEELSVEEARMLAELQASFAPVIKGFATSALSIQMSDPDRRTSEEYRSEVAQHLIECQEFFDERLLWEYVRSGIGHLRITLMNPTDRVFENVQLEVYLPGKIKAWNPEEMSEPPDFLPARPRAFGERTSKLRMAFPSYLGTPKRAFISKQRLGPTIDNSGSARVVYTPVTLRPHAHVSLDRIALSIQEPPGGVIEGTWEATATNAEGRVRGRLSVKVDAFIPVKSLLSSLVD